MDKSRVERELRPSWRGTGDARPCGNRDARTHLVGPIGGPRCRSFRNPFDSSTVRTGESAGLGPCAAGHVVQPALSTEALDFSPAMTRVLVRRSFVFERFFSLYHSQKRGQRSQFRCVVPATQGLAPEVPWGSPGAALMSHIFKAGAYSPDAPTWRKGQLVRALEAHGPPRTGEARPLHRSWCSGYFF